MKKSYVLMLTLLIGCNATNKVKTVPLNTPELNFTSSYINTENDIQNYICDTFANRALDIYTLDFLKANFQKDKNYSVSAVENLHDKNVIDTIYQFSEGTNLIEYYHGTYAAFITKFEVTSNEYPLYGNVSVGNTKPGFKEKFGIDKEIDDVVNIENSSKTAIYTFYFRDNKIHKIRSNLYFD